MIKICQDLNLNEIKHSVSLKETIIMHISLPISNDFVMIFQAILHYNFSKQEIEKLVYLFLLFSF